MKHPHWRHRARATFPLIATLRGFPPSMASWHPRHASRLSCATAGGTAGQRITFIITNTSKTDPATGDGAWYKASDLNLADSTIVRI